MSPSLRRLAVGCVAALVLIPAWWGLAFPEPSGPVLVMHARAATIRYPCEAPPTGPCSEYLLDALVDRGYFVYVVATGVPAADGIREASFQALYDPELMAGFDMFGWVLCADLEVPVAGYRGPWPESGSGNRVVWSVCQTTDVPPDGVQAVAGFFYLYAYGSGSFSLTGPPIPGFRGPGIVSCGGAEWLLPSSQTATLAAGSPSSACNPCVQPCPEVDFLPCAVSTGQLDFGEVPLGSSADRSFTVTNISEVTMNVSVSDTCGEFEIVDPPLPLTLDYGESGAITVRFTPAAIGERFCVLYPCGFSIFATGTGADGVPVERRTWGRIKTAYPR